MKPNELTHETIGAAIAVHRELGPGKPEAAYEIALACELASRGLDCQRQRPVPVVYKGMKLDCGYRLDVLVAGTAVVEIKSVEVVIPVHRAQVLTYLKIGGWKLALLLNFHVATLKDGIQRLVLGLEEQGGQSQEASPPCAATNAPIVVPSFHCDTNCGDPEAERLAGVILASASEVHRELGPGLLPSAYEACLCHELRLRGVPFETKRCLELLYKGTPLGVSDEVSLLVGGRVVVNARAVAGVEPVHEAALLSQLRLGSWNLGLLINFNTIALADGIRRMVLSRKR